MNLRNLIILLILIGLLSCKKTHEHSNICGFEVKYAGIYIGTKRSWNVSIGYDTIFTDTVFVSSVSVDNVCKVTLTGFCPDGYVHPNGTLTITNYGGYSGYFNEDSLRLNYCFNYYGQCPTGVWFKGKKQ
jgi:hypothetical protein